MNKRAKMLIVAGIALAVVTVIILWRQRSNALAAQSALSSTVGAAGGVSSSKADRPGDAALRAQIESGLR